MGGITVAATANKDVCTGRKPNVLYNMRRMVVVIVQARMGSSRFPGKVLQDLCGAPVLAHVLARARAIPGIDVVCCAVPLGRADDGLADTVRALGAVVVRGAEHDVLDRYLVAARACDATVVIRITADCPVIDPAVSGRVLADFLAHRPDYAGNDAPPTWPQGFATEVFSRAALERMAIHADTPYQREHVTPWLRETPGIERRNIALDSGDCSAWRWTLDYQEDLAFLRELLAACPPFPYLPGFDELKAIAENNPQITRINSHLP